MSGNRNIPSGNGTNGKDPKTGKFLPGNKLGTGGDPYAARKTQFRTVLMEAFTPAEMLKVANALLKAARKGEPWAVRELLDRMLGKPKEHLELDAELRLTLTEAVRRIDEHRRIA